MPLDNLTVLILTHNEENNLPFALKSLEGLTKNIIILDSFSKDRTQEIAKLNLCQVYEHTFENYASQRNFGLMKLGVRTEWVLFLDADEWLSQELKAEIIEILSVSRPENGFFIKWRLIWMDKWIRRGYYPKWNMRLFKLAAIGPGYQNLVDETIDIPGPIGYLQHDFYNQNRNGLDAWLIKHLKYAEYAAEIETHTINKVGVRHYSNECRSTLIPFLKSLWYGSPLFIRPFFYFFMRYFIQGGFLDGKEAFVYHFFHAFWFRILIDCKIWEKRRKLVKGVIPTPK